PCSLLCLLRSNPAPSDISTLSLHDALPISLDGGLDDDVAVPRSRHRTLDQEQVALGIHLDHLQVLDGHAFAPHASGKRLPLEHRSEEHTSELQSRENLVCRLLLEKKKKTYN